MQQPIQRMLITITLVVAGGYLSLLGILYTQQASIIHQPGAAGRDLVATPDTIGAEWQDVQLTSSDGVQLHGWYLPATAQDGLTLLLFHGNAGNISHRLDTLALFRDLGLATLIIDYRGYGRSQGTPSEAGLYRDAEAAWENLVATRGIPPSRIVVFGRSLGGAMAAHVAAEHNAAGLILESAFTSVPDLAAERYPLFPVRWLARFEYPTQRFLKRNKAPVLVSHSRDDDVIPYHHGRTLYDTADEPKQFLTLEGGHNTAHRDGRDQYRRALARFLAGLQ